jgi:hypothetical protein
VPSRGAIKIEDPSRYKIEDTRYPLWKQSQAVAGCSSKEAACEAVLA